MAPNCIYHFRWVLRSTDTFWVNRCWYDGSFAFSRKERILGPLLGVVSGLSLLPARIACVKWLKSLSLSSTAYFFKNPHKRAYFVKTRRGFNQIANPHKFWDDLDSQLADEAISGKWFGNLGSKASTLWRSLYKINVRCSI